jgi:hypothetical protein
MSMIRFFGVWEDSGEPSGLGELEGVDAVLEETEIGELLSFHSMWIRGVVVICDPSGSSVLFVNVWAALQRSPDEKSEA